MHFHDAIGRARSTGFEKVRSISVSLSDTVVFPPGAILILEWIIQKYVSRNAPKMHVMTGTFPWNLPLNRTGATMI